MAAASFLALEKCCQCSSEPMKRFKPKDLPPRKPDVLWSRSWFIVPSRDELYSRRCSMVHGGASLLSILVSGSSLMPLPTKAEGNSKPSGSSLMPLPTKAEGNSKGQDDDEDNADKGIVGTIKSLFDPEEKTKSGKVLPKAYLKSAREVVKTLRESLEEDGKDVAKFRRTADAAKESIREYLTGWRGQHAVITEMVLMLEMHASSTGIDNIESYVALEKAIRSLAGFYSKAGPFASLPEDIKTSILDDLKTAEAFL